MRRGWDIDILYIAESHDELDNEVAFDIFVFIFSVFYCVKNVTCLYHLNVCVHTISCIYFLGMDFVMNVDDMLLIL